MNKKIINQNGLTLVELLATIVLTTIISIILFSILTMALENTRVISQETILRDEADIIVSKFVKTLYSTKQNHIIHNITDGENSYLAVIKDLSTCKKDEYGNLITNENDCKLYPIGFKTEGSTQIYFKEEKYQIENNNIDILPISKINGIPEKSSIYEIELWLSITHKRGNKEITKNMVFKNEIQSIVNPK